MSTTLELTVSGVLQSGTDVTRIWDEFNPITTLLASGRTVIEKRLLIAAGATVNIWNWADTSGAEVFLAKLNTAGGFLDISYRVDVPTSASDPTPLSTGPWNTEALSTKAPFIKGTDQIRYSAVAATQVGDTGGHSTMLAGAVTGGTMSKVEVKNRGVDACEILIAIVK